MCTRKGTEGSNPSLSASFGYPFPLPWFVLRAVSGSWPLAFAGADDGLKSRIDLGHATDGERVGSLMLAGGLSSGGWAGAGLAHDAVAHGDLAGGRDGVAAGT